MKNKTIITEKDFQVQLGVISLYKCSSCHKNDIKINYEYCPHCGKELEFEIE